jgi:phosphatidylglycerol---prolipoprotein diacylglyceryl transferase
MIPYFQWIQFTIGPIPIHVWGLMVALGMLTAIAVSIRVARAWKLDTQHVMDMAFWMVLASLIGSRLFYIIGEWQYYVQNPVDILRVWQGGMAFSGGLIGALLAAIIYTRKYQLRFLEYAEVYVLGLPAGITVGRLGCFFIFDHPGTPTTFFLGQTYIDGIVRHNHGLYLSLNGLFIGFIFYWLWRKQHTRPLGFYTVLFLLLYGITRFILDFWRATDLSVSDPRWAGLTLAQYLSLLLVVGALYLWYSMKRTHNAHVTSSTTKKTKKAADSSGK